MRAWPLLLVVALLAPGCSSPAPRPGELAPPAGALGLVEIDGRWSYSLANATAFLTRANLSPPAGALLLGSAVARAGDAAIALDFAGADAGAARLLANGSAPLAGETIVDRAYAEAHGLRVGDALALRADAWDAPLVATSFEMERVRPCAEQTAARLCQLSDPPTGQVALQLRVQGGARDVGFLPEAAELGPGGLPAWWNGTFISPSGTRTPLAAQMLDYASPKSSIVSGNVESGLWRVEFRLESNQTRYNGAAVGIVRVREPGYNWFDDRVLGAETTADQTILVLSWAQPRAVDVRIARLADALPPGIHALLSFADARTLKAARSDEISALLVPDARARDGQLVDARPDEPALAALVARAWPPNASAPARLTFRAPASIDVRTLPAVPGVASATLGLAARAPWGAGAQLDGKPLPDGLRLLAPGGDFPYALPATGRWHTGAAAFENVSRSRTLVLASPDLAPSSTTSSRLVLGADPTGRVVVAAGIVADGPPRTFWSSASLVWGAAQPESAVVLVALAPGADEAATMAAAAKAWAPLGLAPAP